MAARMAHMKKVLVPDKNRPDMAEISKEITKGMEIVFVKTMDDVVREAFVLCQDTKVGGFLTGLACWRAVDSGM